MEDEKVAPLSLSDQLPSAQGLLQANTAPAPFQVNIQTCFFSWAMYTPLMALYFMHNGCFFFKNVYSSQHPYKLLELTLL